MARPQTKQGTGNLQLAVNEALGQIARTRMAMAQAGNHTLDQKRMSSAWVEYGFPQNVSFDNLYSLYSRGGIAHGAVEKLVGKCWKSDPQVIQGDKSDESKRLTAWENSFKVLFSEDWFWPAFAEADRMRLVGRWSAMLLHVADEKAWSEPVEGTAPAIVDITPAWASSLEPTAYNTDENSVDYGKPTAWQYTERAQEGKQGVRRKIHPDRIFFLGDPIGQTIGFLEPAYNSFVSIEKVEGGSGESFLKNAARQLSVNFEKDVNLANIAAMYGVDLKQFQARLEDAARDLNMANDLLMITQGATITPLVSPVSDPTPTYTVNLQSAAASLDIPSKILIGNQQGERASTEDQIYFNDRCQSRRLRVLSFEIKRFVKKLVSLKVIKPIPAKGFVVVWDELNESSPNERLTNAKLMADINQQAIGTGEPVYTREEIRTASGYENEAEDLEGMDDADADSAE